LVKNSLIYCSPYTRTRETLACLLEGAQINTRTGMTIYEDPRLREVERGYADESAQHNLRERHGWFYYRHDGGESAADCYDRTSAFLESLMRQVKRGAQKDVLIVCHGMTLRCFVMRFLHLSVEQFEDMMNLDNGAIVTLAPSSSFKNPQFQNGSWEVDGLTLRSGRVS
jgi:broad specificity phosphatase PhoE